MKQLKHITQYSKFSKRRFLYKNKSSNFSGERRFCVFVEMSPTVLNNLSETTLEGGAHRYLEASETSLSDGELYHGSIEFIRCLKPTRSTMLNGSLSIAIISQRR